MLTMLLYALLAWFLYNLVFKFILPIYRTTKQMKEKFREMQGRMQDNMNQDQSFQTSSATQQRSSQKAPREDYIDFEEIK